MTDATTSDGGGGDGPLPNGRAVHVVGGGVAGLTAAHELVERGFQVTVWEKEARPFHPGDCEVGGMARTQWCSVGDASEARFQRAPSIAAPEAGVAEALTVEIAFSYGSFRLAPSEEEKIARGAKKLKEAYDKWTTLPRGTPKDTTIILVEGYATEAEARPNPPMKYEPEKLDWPSLAAVFPEASKARALNSFGGCVQPGDTPAQTLSRFRAIVVIAAIWAHLEADVIRSGPFWIPVGLGGVPRSFLDEEEQASCARFRPYQVLAPGEHGYRYFPAFYRHVSDTMKRIPLFESAAPVRPRDVRREVEVVRHFHGADDPPRWVDDPDHIIASLLTSLSRLESPRTVADNLVPTYQFAVATGDGEPPLTISRLRPRSFLEVRTLLETSCRRLGVDLRDGLLFELKVAQYLTSSAARRRTYEGTTWSDFLGAGRYRSPVFRALIERWPQALVGLRASLADARTIGTVAIQLLLDQTSISGNRDCTLNGPTTRAWFDPWRQYLAARGVIFKQGTLRDLKREDKWLDLVFQTSSDPGDVRPPDLPSLPYILLALPPLEAKRVFKMLFDSCSPEAQAALPDSLRPLLSWHLPPAGTRGGLPVDQARPQDTPTGPLRHYGGIQLYFDMDLGPAQGHIYFAKSEWGLSAIAQSQFWQRRLQDVAGNIDDDPQVGVQRHRPQYVAILSVDIGDWHARATRLGRCAAECTREELAREVWAQISEGIAYEGWQPQAPFAYHVDDDMRYEVRAEAGPAERPVENLSPYPVNLAGDWDNRPGRVDRYYYDMFQGVVIAGAYAKTWTRLTTMESASESARRAVNAILVDYRKNFPNLNNVPDRCQLWNPEDNELDDLQILKDIDAALMERGLPHLFEILEIERLVEGGLEVLDPTAILDGVLGGLGGTSVAGIPLNLIRRALASLFG